VQSVLLTVAASFIFRSDGIFMTRTHCLSLSAGLLALLAIASATSAVAGDPIGTWLVEDRTARIRIAACGNALCGTIVWLSEPNDSATGKPQTDKLNSDPQLRSRPMLGVPVVIGMQRESEDKWTGQIYNPDDGNTYRGSIELIGPTRLRVRGCWTIYCETQTWTRSN
jgi:uncharacterized protein (DUF2147 family)